MLARNYSDYTMKDKKFKVFGIPWTMKFIDGPVHVDEDKTVYGETDFTERLIRVSTHNSDGKPRLQCEVEVVILHELMHCIFGEGQYHSCNEDEPLVEWCAKCLKSLIDQRVI